MLTNEKIRVLLIFCHSRLSGKYTNNENLGNVIDNKNANSQIEHNTKQIIETLEKNKFTIDDLNNLPHSPIASIMTYYYNVALNCFEKHIKKGDVLIEGIIGLSILSYLFEEKQFKTITLPTPPSEIISLMEKETLDQETRSLITKMHKVASEVIDMVDKTKLPKRKK